MTDPAAPAPRVTGLCRDCTAEAGPQPRCPSCGSPRVLQHPELFSLTVAHVDCDAFFAAIEKRDNPELAHTPVIIGGARRGVVSTACYLARIKGVRSAMPMFQARKLCPEATVIRPDMEKYVSAGRQIRRMMHDLTPLVEPLSIDEAFMDLSGTERLHGMPPARTLARFALAVEREIGITVSIGLASNKFLAKIASDLDKPRGFAVLSRSEAAAFLRDRPVGFIWGVGAAMESRLERDGIRTVGDLQRLSEADLFRKFGASGKRLAGLAHGLDDRPVTPNRPAKSVSAETTFNEDICEADELTRILWRLCERVSTRLKAADLAGRTVTLKLKTSDFRTRTRAHSLPSPTRLAGRIFDCGRHLLLREADGTRYRLIGIGVSDLADADLADLADLIDPSPARKAAAEVAVDKIRERFGRDVLQRGLAFTPKPKP
jgi:DNA polymerase IV